MNKPLWLWLTFGVVILVLLLFDLGFLHRKPKVIGVKESLKLWGFYVAIAIVFGIFVWFELGPERGSEFFTGYLVEESLSIDNIFVISVILSYFAVPRVYQHRVLFWGILGVIILRGLMIGMGSLLVSRFDWVLYLFGAFLIYIGIKMLFVKTIQPDIAHNQVLKFLRKHCRITSGIQNNAFFVRAQDPVNPAQKIWWITPLFVALVLIELADVIFAIDSIPAIFSITKDPYIVYTSNIFAILGLRAMYFALKEILERFVYLQYVLALILIFIGSKVFIVHFLGLEKISPFYALGVTLSLLGVGMILSWLKTKKKGPI